MSRIFNISCDYVGSFTVSLSQMSLAEIVDDVNEKHAHAWSEICEHAHINTPLSPLIAEVDQTYMYCLSVEAIIILIVCVCVSV